MLTLQARSLYGAHGICMSVHQKADKRFERDSSEVDLTG